MGYRIELGEIEATLSGIPSIREVACLFDRERDKILCIYTGGEETGEVAKAARAMFAPVHGAQRVPPPGGDAPQPQRKDPPGPAEGGVSP